MWWYVSCKRMTFAVRVDERGVIVESAPIGRKFVGQPATNLGRWMRGLGDFKCARLAGP